jgi:chromosomal replication initiation ATPase DnaA
VAPFFCISGSVDYSTGGATFQVSTKFSITSDLVTNVLSQANEKFDRKYELKRLGYDLGGIAVRVAEIYEIEVDDIFLKGKQQKRVKARSLFCFWAVRELGISLTELA